MSTFFAFSKQEMMTTTINTSLVTGSWAKIGGFSSWKLSGPSDPLGYRPVRVICLVVRKPVQFVAELLQHL